VADLRDDVRVTVDGELLLDEPPPAPAADPMPEPTPEPPPPEWPPLGTIETYVGRAYGHHVSVAFAWGRTGRVFLVGLGDQYNGEPLDKRGGLLDDLYYSQRESWALGMLAACRSLDVAHRTPAAIVVSDGGSLHQLVIGTAQEMAEILALARGRAERTDVSAERRDTAVKRCGLCGQPPVRPGEWCSVPECEHVGG
jgi:hypothetical protein